MMSVVSCHPHLSLFLREETSSLFVISTYIAMAVVLINFTSYLHYISLSVLLACQLGLIVLLLDATGSNIPYFLFLHFSPVLITRISDICNH